MTVVAFTSCLSPSLDSEDSGKLITFQTSGVSVETRASLADAQITDLWVFDYVGDVCVQQVHQSSSASAFDSPTLSMTHGEHTLRFVASRGTEPIVNEDVLSWTKPLDTFASEFPLTIDDNTDEVQVVTLQRIVSRIKIIMKDKLPANVYSAVLTLDNRSMGLNLSTLIETDREEIEQEFTIESMAGKTGGNLSVYSLQSSDESTTAGLALSLYDGEGNQLIERVINNVPMKRNQTTTLSGYVFDLDITANVSVTDAWDEDNEIEY